MTRRRVYDDEVLFTFRLPKELHERLQKISGSRGMTEELRRRLSLTFYLDDFDPKWEIRAEIARLQKQLDDPSA